jgi:catechol 2,3-dioxygenase-like lactoylglutathione lyase family enzyme
MSPANHRLTEIHHVGLTVSDIEKSVQFYRDILGLTLVRRREVDADYVGQQTGYPGVRLSTASFKMRPDSTQSIEIVQYRNYVGERSVTATNRAGNTHLCFQTADIGDVVEHLQAQGVRFRSEPVTITSGPNEGGLVVYLYDPDDYIIELFQPRARLEIH